MQQLLFFLSPAKKMNLQPFQAKLETSSPLLLKNAQAIMKEITGLCGKELEKVMAAKGKLIDEVERMHTHWERTILSGRLQHYITEMPTQDWLQENGPLILGILLRTIWLS